ncbi:MAG: hypothetical protein ACI9J3_002768 [Parvicellaceae bacterium]|jgi:hypothetical protein
MKKKVILLAAMFAGATCFAQDLTSKKGETILPEADDWAITLDAAPFLDFAGGFLGGNASSPAVNYAQNQAWHIKGKMFVDATTAYRVGIRLGFGSDKTTSSIGSSTVTTAPVWPALPTMVEDVQSQGATNVVVTGGMEMRRGKGRLQGFYGAELFISMANTRDKYTYGNTLDAPGLALGFTTDFGSNTGVDPFYGNGARMTESKTSSFGLGLRGFIGAEYFIFAKMSIGAELGWGLGVSSGSSSETWEGTDGVALGTIVDETANKSNGFGLDTDIANNAAGVGSLNITFHF